MPTEDDGVDRRTLVRALGAGAAIGLAGCIGGDDPDGSGNGNGDDAGNGEAERGERVPAVSISYWSNVGGGTAIMEDMLPVIQENLQELGLDVDVRPTEFTSDVHEVLHDERTRDLQLYYYTPEPGRLDPNPLLERFDIARAGDRPGMNVANWANCEYSQLVREQVRQGDQEDRRETVIEAQRILSEEAVVTPVVPYMTLGVANADLVEPNAIGDFGIMHHNVSFYIHSEPKERDFLLCETSPITVETLNYPVLDSTPSLSLWNHLVSSTLVEYDENFDLENVLAEEISVEDEGETIVVELRENADFHNGDPVTAEDVKFTFEHFWDNTGEFPMVDEAPYESIEVEDEKTVVFNLEHAFPPLIEKAFHRWGILHKATWEPAYDDPGGFSPPEDFPGSGPFELGDITIGDSMSLEPADTHPVYEPDHGIVFQAYRDATSTYEAFRAEEIDVMSDVSFTIFDDVQEQMGDQIETAAGEGMHPYAIIPQAPAAPSKFVPFRKALGKSIDRELINEVAMMGKGYEELHATMYTRTHPYAPEDGEIYKYTDDPSGDIEDARQTLDDAGWSWDDDGNLRYPSDVNLDPLWPAEGHPDPDDFGCIDEDGEWVGMD